MELNHVHVMGDLTSRNLSEMKAYTKVEVQIDMLALYKEAYKKLEEEYIKDELTDDDVNVYFSDIVNYNGDTPFDYQSMRKNIH